MAGRGNGILKHHGLGLALDDGFAGVIDLVVFDVGGGRVLPDFGQIFLAFLHPLLQAHRLVLEGVRQLVSHHRLLLFHGHPVEQVHGFCFGIVVAGHFFPQEGNQKRFQIEVARQQAKFFQHKFRPPQALGVLVVQVLGEKGNDLIAAGQFALDFPLDGQAGLLAVEIENFVDGVEQFLGLTRGDLDFVFWRLFLRRGWAWLFLLWADLVWGGTLVRLVLIWCCVLSRSLRRLVLRARENRTTRRGEQTNRKKRPKNPRRTPFSLIH